MPPTNRRHHLCQLSALGLAVSLPVRAVSSSSIPVLRVLAWPGYAEPEVVKSFEHIHGVQVELTIIDTDEALWRRISANHSSDFDVFAINTAELQRCIRHGLVSPVPGANIPNLKKQLPRFQDVRSIRGLVHGGKAMAVPFTYAEMGLIYDRQQIGQAPESINALWDVRYKGRVLAYNGGSHSFSLAAQTMGLSSPFKLGTKDWPVAVDKLIALRRNVAAFYAQPDESLELFKSRQAALLFANYGSQQLQLLKGAGLDVGYAIPKEGALAWLDCWAITRGVRDLALASAWINHLLGKPASDLLRTRQGLASTTEEPEHTRPTDRRVWLEPVEDDDRRNRMWARIVSGDRAAKVLAS